jgi:hypothetical protein
VPACGGHVAQFTRRAENEAKARSRLGGIRVRGEQGEQFAAAHFMMDAESRLDPHEIDDLAKRLGTIS